MLELGYNTWNDVPVILIDYRKEVKNHLAFKHAVEASPLMAMRLNAASVVIYDAFFASCDADHIRHLAGALKPGQPFITVCAAAIETLTELELDGVLFHELAHILSNDFDRDGGEDEILNNLHSELAADDYAASKVSKEALRSGIKKLVRYSAILTADIHGIHVFDALSDIYETTDLVQRLQRLN